jgi:hypothetical protein
MLGPQNTQEDAKAGRAVELNTDSSIISATVILVSLRGFRGRGFGFAMVRPKIMRTGLKDAPQHGFLRLAHTSGVRQERNWGY